MCNESGGGQSTKGKARRECLTCVFWELPEFHMRGTGGSRPKKHALHERMRRSGYLFQSTPDLEAVLFGRS